MTTARGNFTPSTVEKARKRAYAPEAISMYWSSCGCGLMTHNPTISAKAPQLQFFPSLMPRRRRSKASGKSALTNSFPSCPGETADAICPLIM
jgi:hypothetical protein